LCSESCLTSFHGRNEMVGFKIKMSQVTDVAETENQEAMADQVITMEPELSLCLFVECYSH
jgi:hypothetical protein